MKDQVEIRKIIAADNPELARIIRLSLEEFGAAKPGTVYFDPSTDHLYELFTPGQSAYFVAVVNDKVAGGAGIYPTEGLPEGTCELVKMYISAAARGKGLGKILLQKCLEEAKNNGFNQVYIETMPELKNAIGMYRKNGFAFISKAMGNSGHTGCDLFMIKVL